MRFNEIGKSLQSQGDPVDSAILAFVCLGIALISVLTAQTAALQKRASALSRIEAKLDLLLKNAGIGYDAFADLPPPVVEALRAGEKFRAIKCYREATGAGLKEAKEFIEEAQRRAGPVA
jgi:ribosomal protein L7/L12